MTKTSRDDFHKRFDEETLLKLKIFRFYVREWLPVFLSRCTYVNVNIFDFFAGRGGDGEGNPGSPLIILDEIIGHRRTRAVDAKVKLVVHLNDIDKDNVDLLRQRLGEISGLCGCDVRVSNKSFDEAFEESVPLLADERSANLVILDQFGFKELTCEVFTRLTGCSATDLICFVTSSQVKRFGSSQTVQRYFGMQPSRLAAIPNNEIHRYICDYYRGCIPAEVSYYLAPFSIKSQANVYGLIFGSGSLYGLEKFLRVCWNYDRFTGEANFPIDHDPVATDATQPSLFAEDNIPKKQRGFAVDLAEYLGARPRTNHEVYRFTLERGFLPKHAAQILRRMQEEGRAIVLRMDGSQPRKGAFYLSWKDYEREPILLKTTRKDTSDEANHN